MQLTLGLLADYANKSSEGKLNILGAFDRIWAARYPAAHQELKLVLRFEVHPAELGQTKKFQIQLRNETGQRLFELSGDMALPKTALGAPSGQMLQMDQILGLNRMPIPAAGRYEFVVMINGEMKGQVPFTAAIRESAPPDQKPE